MQATICNANQNMQTRMHMQILLCMWILMILYYAYANFIMKMQILL